MMKKIMLILMLVSTLGFAAPPPAADVVGGTNSEYTQFPYNPPTKNKKIGPAFDENGLNRAPLIILDQHGKPLTPDSKVLNRGPNVGCGLAMVDGVIRVVGCK